ncbi:hypothetical protein KEM55_002217 [Ascosphaera atra]|nr:hypothetical protein KEM55_002217 [Ascosphaera atra]
MAKNVAKIVDGRKQVQRLPTPYAIFDFHFSPRDGTVFATASSAATVDLYRVSREGDSSDPTVSLIRSFTVNEDPSMAALWLAWTPPSHPMFEHMDGFAVSFPDGSISLFHAGPSCKSIADIGDADELQEVQVPNNDPSIEVWYLAFGGATSSTGSCLLFAGDDFGALITHELLASKDNNGSFFEIEVQNSTSDRGRLHTAGVTAILPLTRSTSGSGSPAEVLLTGSYDECVRVYKSSHMPRERGVLAEECLGGGVWRLQLLSEQEDEKVKSYLVLASCMHAGTRVIQVNYSMDTDTWEINVLAQFTEHESMNYASGIHKTASDVIGRAGKGRHLVCVSSSFYDKRLCVWKVDV